ncbi:MAG: M28 family peptidase [Saprospirales bacterium]|nr:M28 family peptidase [Saprospirales bacterium]
MKKIFLFLSLLFVHAAPLFSQEISADSINALIRREGFERSRVMDLAWAITDRNGPRLTGSEGLDEATEWALTQLKYWNLDNVHTEEWGPFGRGWELKEFTLEAIGEYYFPVIGYPKAWSGPVEKGPVTGEVIYLNAGTEEELQKYKGKLKGKFVLLDTIRAPREWDEPVSKRLGPQDLLELANAPMPSNSGGRRWRGYGNDGFGQKLWDFIYDQQPMAVLDRGYKGDYGTVFVGGARARSEQNARDKGVEVIPQVTLSIEHYNRIFRLLEKRRSVKLRMRLDAVYHESDLMERNIIGEIPGSDLREEVVMFGAHFDSWHAGTGATDNGCGSAVMMEAARILQEVFRITGTRPRRTLRIALWTGEEQGLLGSRAYCNEHFAVRDSSGEIISFLPEQAQVSAYFNLDNGTGKIRGVYQQGNLQVGPIFRDWLSPWEDLGATTLSLGNTGGTDHLSFDRVGIPGFQFIQDPVEYDTRTHHSNMDNWDHLSAEDLKQAATIIASFIWQAAMRDEMLPRKESPLTPR